ncbi:hypothetical protein E3P77_02780 [Wallemia ichthyophaga]|uniref:F-box domain-containing protein n=1 Tax=Wallemia ichthyophaga TaxID=245174 RepID=A0A4T0EYH5_WALIC|nr:hypothetical protein E3P98_03361 [Wallemia ichthyophaga]TIB09030.1 hypothetical protein E3P93_03317 [Wallemia ichthyophaga]TIB09343.1 hypothetical protein E3P90_03316 [Wallemia ichthyophaga]TIB20232.1 hypothetical protein E3P89_03334 [Wallemia ichthyophaga]TIB21833.1 hypothetical protein E3P88_03329 [Wallemia ichthyophaga]
MRIYNLNLDVFGGIGAYLDARDILNLRFTCRFLRGVADHVLIPNKLNDLQRKVLYNTSISPIQKLRQIPLTDDNWSTCTFHPTQLVHTHSSIPVLNTHNHLLILASRSAVFVWDRCYSPWRYTRFVISNHSSASMDITGLVVVECVGDSVSLIASHFSGLVQRVILNLHSKKSSQTAIYCGSSRTSSAISSSIRTPNLTSLTGTSNVVISAAQMGQLRLLSPNAPWIEHPPINVETNRLWGVDYNSYNGSLSASHNYTPSTLSAVSLFHLRESNIQSTGSLKTPPHISSFTATNGSSTNGVLASPDIIIAGFYDSGVRVYDCRCGYAPVKQYQDALDPQPVYSVDVGGAYDSLICAGSALYSRLRIIDARMQSDRAHHVYAAESGDRSSPVYQLQTDHSHCFLATESNVYDLDFSSASPDHRFPTVTV